MQKSLFALAVAALFSANALAQTNVTIYGIADAGLVSESGGPNGRATNVSSGIASGSRLGFKGKEDLGGGTAAVFTLESGVNMDTGTSGQGGVLFGRQAFVGLTGRYGAVTLGRQYSPYYKVLRDIGDAFGAVSMAGRSGNLMATNTRTDNMVEYASPVVGGVRADLAYGAGEQAGDSAKNRTLGASLGYAAGRLTVAAAYHRIDNATATDSVTNTLLSGNYNFGVVTTYLSVAKNKGTGTADSRDLVAGVAVPIGGGKLLVSHVRHDDRSGANKDAHQWGIGYVYKLSKRTDLYTAYAAIDNQNGATFKVGNATDKGTGDKAFNLGIRHSF
jgi:predicted porin